MRGHDPVVASVTHICAAISTHLRTPYDIINGKHYSKEVAGRVGGTTAAGFKNMRDCCVG